MPISNKVLLLRDKQQAHKTRGSCLKFFVVPFVAPRAWPRAPKPRGVLAAMRCSAVPALLCGARDASGEMHFARGAGLGPLIGRALLVCLPGPFFVVAWQIGIPQSAGSRADAAAGLPSSVYLPMGPWPGRCNPIPATSPAISNYRRGGVSALACVCRLRLPGAPAACVCQFRKHPAVIKTQSKKIRPNF